MPFCWYPCTDAYTESGCACDARAQNVPMHVCTCRISPKDLLYYQFRIYMPYSHAYVNMYVHGIRVCLLRTMHEVQRDTQVKCVSLKCTCTKLQWDNSICMQASIGLNRKTRIHRPDAESLREESKLTCLTMVITWRGGERAPQDVSSTPSIISVFEHVTSSFCMRVCMPRHTACLGIELYVCRLGWCLHEVRKFR